MPEVTPTPETVQPETPTIQMESSTPTDGAITNTMLPKGFFLFFLVSLVVFLPFGVWISQDIKREKTARESIWNPAPPVDDNELYKMQRTGQLPPEQASDQWQMTPPENQPIPTPMPPQGAMPAQPTDPTYNPNTGRSYADYSGRNAAISVIQDQLKWTSWNIRDCLAIGGTVKSGVSGASFCSIQPGYRYPEISYCGPNPTDTVYTVMRENSDTWDVAITCTNFPECNGPKNALCTSSSCTFANDCLAK